MDETAIGYLYRLVDEVLTKTDTYYFFKFLVGNGKIVEGLARHLDCPAVASMIFKALEPGS